MFIEQKIGVPPSKIKYFNNW